MNRQKDIEIYVVAQDQLSPHINLWDVKVVGNDELLGIIELFENKEWASDGDDAVKFTFTDTTGRNPLEDKGSLNELRDDIAYMINSATLH